MSEVAAWFLYTIVVTVLLGLAAVAGESALRNGGKPGRWAWAGAMAASAGLPVLAWLGLGLRSVPSVPESALIPLAPLAAPVALDGAAGGLAAAGPGLDHVLVAGWVLVTAAVLVYMALSWASIVRDRRHWRRASVGGIRVALTPDTGPAAWGIRHPEILLPEWAIGLESRVRRLMLLHEGEHVRAGDTRMVLAGLVLLAAAPWNLPLWWQFRRLRQAIELDCDARVLRRAPDARRYGTLLLEVGRRRATPVMVVALADPPSFLERRIRLITEKARIPSLHRVGGMALVALALVLVAVCTRDPMAVSAEPVDAIASEFIRVADVTPSTEPPSAAGPAESGAAAGAVDERVAAAAPVDESPDADSGERGGAGAGDPDARIDADLARLRTRIADFGSSTIDAETRTRQMRELPDGSPEAALGETAMIAVPPPAVPAGAAIGAITQRTGDRVVSPGPDPATESAESGDAGSARTAEPQLQNLSEIQTLIEREYPPLLRDAGIGGTAGVQLLIGEDGSIERIQLADRTGQPQLDDAALRVAAAMRFSPALNRGETKAVWVSLPIAFVSR